MQQRLDYSKAAPGTVQAMYKLEKFVEESGLERSMLELVKTRVSQINGCAFCIDMHTKDARALGESEQRLYCLNAWRETPFYTERERAALAGRRQSHLSPGLMRRTWSSRLHAQSSARKNWSS